MRQISVKYGIKPHTSDIFIAGNDNPPSLAIYIPFELEVTLVTPGGVPGVFDEHVVQASGFIMAVTDSEYAVVYGVKVLVVIKYFSFAIFRIDDTTTV